MGLNGAHLRYLHLSNWISSHFLNKILYPAPKKRRTHKTCGQNLLPQRTLPILAAWRRNRCDQHFLSTPTKLTPNIPKKLTLPPRVAESRKCVPYFLIRFSVICWRVGRRPSSLMLRKNSGASGSGEPRKFLLSTARLFTFQRPNSLQKQSSSHSEMCHSDKCPSFANDSALLGSWGRLAGNYNGPWQRYSVMCYRQDKQRGLFIRSGESTP